MWSWSGDSFSWFVLTPIAFIVQLQPSVQLLWFICPQQVCNARTAVIVHSAVEWHHSLICSRKDFNDRFLIKLVKSKKVSQKHQHSFSCSALLFIVLHFRVFCCKLVLIGRTAYYILTEKKFLSHAARLHQVLEPAGSLAQQHSDGQRFVLLPISSRSDLVLSELVPSQILKS